MTPVFTNDDRLAALRHAASSWMGTPFSGNSNAKGRGVSCQHLAACIYQEGGFDVPTPPEAPMSFCRFSNDSLIERWMSEQSRLFVRTGTSEIIPGDLLCFRLGRSIHHCGVLLFAGEFIHALDPVGVTLSPLADATWARRLEAAWRPIA